MSDLDKMLNIRDYKIMQKLLKKYGVPCNLCKPENIDICIRDTFCVCFCHKGREEELRVI